MDNTLQKLIKDVINSSHVHYDKENADNYILRCKNAVVIWYQPDTLITCVKFCEDKNENTYHLYNRCHCYLIPGDIVKVYYTTNAAKGWIAVRCGKPNFRDEYGQKIGTPECCEEDTETCCTSSCCTEAATQHKNKETVTVEEWSERIEGTEEEIKEYEQNEGKDSPFHKSNG